jgi:hypothetical protein
MNIVQSGSAMQTDFDMYIDGTHVPASSGTSGTLSGANGNFSIGYGANGSNYFDGTYQELIIYNSQLSGADREAVETEINNYYSIYV